MIIKPYAPDCPKCTRHLYKEYIVKSIDYLDHKIRMDIYVCPWCNSATGIVVELNNPATERTDYILKDITNHDA